MPRLGRIGAPARALRVSGGLLPLPAMRLLLQLQLQPESDGASGHQLDRSQAKEPPQSQSHANVQAHSTSTTAPRRVVGPRNGKD